MLSSPLCSFLPCAISFKDPHNSFSLFNPSDMLPNALSPLQVLPDLFWQLRRELACIVSIIWKIFHSIWRSGLSEERKCLSLHNLLWKIFLKLPLNLFGSQQGKIWEHLWVLMLMVERLGSSLLEWDGVLKSTQTLPLPGMCPLRFVYHWHKSVLNNQVQKLSSHIYLDLMLTI